MSDRGSAPAMREPVRPVGNPAMAAEVWAGLTKPQKELSSKYFYDARGSELFDEITRLPEYYPTRTERALLDEWAHHWVHALHPRSIVELGAGSADKTRILLDALRGEGAAYVPVDISAAYLQEVASRIGAEYPRLRVIPAESDITEGIDLPPGLPRPVLFAFLGSTIGNFGPVGAARLLRRIAGAMTVDDRFLMGVDLKKDPAVLELAYNDARGVTAEFNRNILRVLNRDIGTDFDVEAFDHLAYYDPVEERIEMHLVARDPQVVHVPGHGRIATAPGESIRTEISCKYDRERVTELFGAAGLVLEEWTPDSRDFYALAVGRRVS